MALLERLEIVIEADARTAEREFDRIGRQASESLESIETAAGEVGDNASKRLAGAAPEFARAGEKLSDAAGKELDLSAAASEAAADVSRALESQRQEAGQSGRRLGDSAGAGVAAGVRDAGAEVRAAGGRLGGDAGEGVSGGLLESLSGIGGDIAGAMDDALGALPAGVAGPVAAAGAAIGAAMVTGIADALETESLGDIVAARVGEGVAKSEEFARVTTGVFRDAWGESKAEVADAVDAVYSTLEDSRGSERALEDLTSRAQAMADVFGIDVQQAVLGAGVLIQNGLAEDAVDALDQIVAAAQAVPAALRDDVLDIFSEGEYVQAFETLGYTGEQAIGMIVKAAQEGSFQLDKTGDAVTEFTRLNQDMAEATVDAYDIIGLSAEDTQAKILQGGPVARQAFLDVVDALQRVPDPADRARAAIGLFGTPLSDVANDSEQLNTLLEIMASEAMPGVEGASDRLRDSIDNTATSFTVVKREMLGFFEEYANQRLTPLSDLIETDDPGLADYAETAGRTVGDSFVEYFKITVFGLPGLIGDALLGGSDDAEDDAEALGYGLGQAIGRGITAAQIAQQGDIATGFAPDGTDWQLGPDGEWVAPEKLGEITAAAGPARMSLEEINREIELSNDLFDLAEQRASNYLDRIGNTSSLDDAISAQLNLRDATEQLMGGLEALQGVDIEAFADGAVQVSDEAAGALGDVAGAASAAQQQIANTLQFEGEAAAVEEANRLRDGFTEMFEAAGLTDDQVQDLLESMGLLPDQVTTAIQLSGADEALAKLDLLQGRYEEDIPDTVQTQIDIAIAEGRFVDAANLISLWVKDQEDGYIDNPLLVAMGLGDTTQASADVDAWKRSEENKPPAGVRVGADTSIAYGAVNEFLRQANNARANVTVGVRFANEGLGAFPIFGRRAAGGPVAADRPYLVGERGPELFMPSSSGTVLNNGDTAAALKGNNVTINQTIITPDPMVSAAESARKLRDASYLVGA